MNFETLPKIFSRIKKAMRIVRDVRENCGVRETGRMRSARERSGHHRSARESLAWLPPVRDERARPAVSGTEAGVAG